MTRPSLRDVHVYRRYVGDAMLELLDKGDDALLGEIEPILTLGLHHEQQHQELILTDILHAFSCNPLLPAYRQRRATSRPKNVDVEPIEWLRCTGGVVEIGHRGPDFCFDNELPRHDVLLRPYEIAHRLVTRGEYAVFIADGGYARPELWLSDGWAMVQRERLASPAYWRMVGGHADDISNWLFFGLNGVEPMDPNAPVSHLAFMRRRPTPNGRARACPRGLSGRPRLTRPASGK